MESENSEEGHVPRDEGLPRERGLRPLCAGTVGLCSLYYVRLMKERRRRECDRRRRMLRFQRTRARERLRFAVLWTSRLLVRRDGCVTSSAPDTEPPASPMWSDVDSSALWSTVMEKTLSPSDWMESFRVTKSTYNYLCHELRPVLQKMDASVGHAIPPDVQVAITLWRLGSTCEYLTTQKIFGVSRSALCKIVQDVCEAVVSILTPKFISVPEGDFLRDTVKGFEQRYGIPRLAGVIGTFHVPVTPPEEGAGQYFNSKGWHSVVLQAVVDSSLCFWDLNIGSPGNSSDCQVLLKSELYEWGSEGTLFPNTRYSADGMEVPIHLLGSRSYPRLPWLMTPFAAESRPERSELNRQFFSALRVSPVAFGRLGGRWCCLLKCSGLDLSFLPTLIAVCCTLHNICESRGDPFQERWLEKAAEEELEQPSECEEEESDPERMSEEIRDTLANSVWAQNGAL
ncbi:uncharacterized protein [Ranitomeya imitator]|uniref:uncharacterized protein n=1 Tax=Ranitomeya imitator TaxID=111125 RepID=UPI0037E754AF